MSGLRIFANTIVDSGITPSTSKTDARYVRFLNATLMLFGLAQLPVIWLLASLALWTPMIINFLALGLCGLGFLLNRNGHPLAAKTLVITVVTSNTAYFAIIMGSSAPAHHWLIPMTVLGLLTFKPSEWVYAAVLVSLSVMSFLVLELSHRDLVPIVNHFSSPTQKLRAAQGSTVSAMLLTLVFVGMMHRRFANAETELSKEKAQSDRLLRAILPEDIAQELRETGKTQAIRHEDVSILFADIVGFTPLAASMPAEEVVSFLEEIFEQFDSIIAACGVEKIKTIGDAYMVASGVPQAIPDHAERLAQCAIEMLESIDQFNSKSNRQLQLRIGLHRGEVVAGVIGTSKFAYDLWGESVNLASRLESSGEPGRIHVSDDFRKKLQEKMHFEERGEVSLKGVGLTRTHWLISSS